EAGKHVFCEKPIALNLDEAEGMISAAKKHNVKLQIGFMRRFDPEFKRAKSLIEQGEIGKPVLIKSVGRGPGLPPKWACVPEMSIGMLAEVNSHDFDSIRWFMECEISSLYALAGAYICQKLVEEFPEFYDVAVVCLRLSNGSLGIIDGGCPVGYGYDARVEILGTEGLLSVGELPRSSLLICRKEKVLMTETFQSWRERFKDAYLAEAQHFVNCILTDSEPSVTGMDGKKALEAVLAATESIRRREIVYLPLR
ncbi:MAG: Gfo/Idh/MocA family oxidoreductase, partial [Candidatus Bathyarchaeia archaeon]